MGTSIQDPLVARVEGTVAAVAHVLANRCQLEEGIAGGSKKSRFENKLQTIPRR